MKQARWLVVALVLLGLGAWLMAGKGSKNARTAPRSFPVGPRVEEHQKMESRRTLALPAPSATGSAEAPPAGPRDPVLMAFATPTDVAIVAEAQVLLNAPVVQMFFDCLGAQERENFEREISSKGFDPRKIIDRVGMFKEEGKTGEVMVLQGRFAGVDWATLFPDVEARKMGEQARVYQRKGEAPGRELIGVFRDEVVLIGEGGAVERALKRLTGELAPGKPPLQDSEAYGEIYGVLGREALASMAPPEMQEKMKHTLSKVEIHVDATDDVLLVLDGSGEEDEHGKASEEIVELAKSMAAGVAVARVKARADGDDLLVDLLDQSRVRPFMGGLRAEVAIPLATVKKHLAGCKK